MRASFTKAAAATIAALTIGGGMALATATPAAAQHMRGGGGFHGGGYHGGWHGGGGYYGGGWGWGPGAIVGGLAAGALIASAAQPYGYGYGYGYGYPAYGGCVAYRPVYDGAGRYMGRQAVRTACY